MESAITWVAEGSTLPISCEIASTEQTDGLIAWELREWKSA